MPLAGAESYRRFLDETFNVNYNPHIIQDKGGQSNEPIVPPLKFYDRHIAANYTLKHVSHLPSIPHLLSKTCDTAIANFIENGHKMLDTGYHFELNIPEVEFTDARSVREYYIDHIGVISKAYLSKLCFHPHVENWPSVFEFRKDYKTDTFYTAEGHLTVAKASSGGVFLDKKIEDSLSQATKDALNTLLDKAPRLAMWHVFPMVDTFTAAFHNVMRDVEFQWETSRTAGYFFTTHTIPPPDAKTLVRKLHIRSSGKSRVKESTSYTHSAPKAGKFVTLPPAIHRGRYRPDFRHYLQRAWAQAAIHNTTFIILNCGRYERIGIRHRASQTLYLSGVIDTVNIADPRYRKLHVGLYIAIVQDALERIKSADTHIRTANMTSKKRFSDNLEDTHSQRYKKRRRRSKSPVPVGKSMSEHLVHRKLALVNLDYDAFCSSVPSSFIRVGESCKRDFPTEDTDWTKDVDKQKKFPKEEYFTLRLFAPLGHGAVGIVHPAQAELALQSGDVLRENLVFKLAFTEEQQTKLKSEFEIYCRMSRTRHIEGVLDVHGLFYNAESNVMGLLMANGGQNLRQREIERTGKFAEQVQTTVDEREAFVRALKSIHRADIRHYDIRADNLTVNPDGKVFIIDFDCAEWHAPDSLEDEVLRLNEVLEGNYKRRLRY